MPSQWSRRVGALALALVVAACSSTSSALTTSQDGSGRLCTPTDSDGTTTIAHDIVTNSSAEPLTLTNVTLPGSPIVILKWTTMPLDWSGPATKMGDHVPDAEGTRVIQPGASVLLALVVRNDTSDRPPWVAPVVEYTDGTGAQGQLTLSWEISVGAPGVEDPCHDDDPLDEDDAET